jgi:hypothetical protein
MLIKKYLTTAFSILNGKESTLRTLLSAKFLENFFSTLKFYFFIFVNVISVLIIILNVLDTIKTFFMAYKLRSTLLLENGLNVADIFSPDIFFLELDEFVFFNQMFSFIYIFLWKFLFAILMIVPILLIVAYSTLLERKVLSAAQRRRGPNKVGVKGSAQPLIDGVKLILKEIIIPVQSEN